MSEANAPADIAKHEVARGAGTVALSRLGAIIEIVTTPVYTWLFGVPAFGFYTVLWSVVNLASNCVDLGFTAALQRVVPQADDETRAHAALKLALLVGLVPSTLVAIAVTLLAEPVSALFSVAPADRPQAALAVAVFAWALPLWTFSEIATAALRARRAFGPEVRLRIFWEQIVRLLLALVAYAAGMTTMGLFAAHLLSLAIVCALALRLIARYYDWQLLWRAPLDRAVLKTMLGFGLSMMPNALARRAFFDLPPILLNLMLPGAAGATAAGLYAIARKVSSVPQIIRNTFNYVMAPLASAQAKLNRAAIQPLYAFATRLSMALSVPVAVALVLLGDGILGLFAPGAEAALPMLVALVVARGIEAGVGPAGPVLDVIGRRRWLLFNALAGLGIWLGLATILVPLYEGLGMAIAVGSGMVGSSLLALIQLRIADRLDALSPRLALGLAVSAATGAVMWGAAVAAFPFGEWIQSGVVLALLFPALWLGLRFGLTPHDREALGRAGRTLRLV
jgi:O-antigen/teichoic acid export membrane protein